MSASDWLKINFEDEANNFRDFKYPDLLEETLALIGPSSKGPAFVPTPVLSYGRSNPGETLNTFENIFGTEASNYSHASIMSNIWLNSGASQLVYTRTLGIGDGSGINETTGIYNSSGFVVGEPNSRDSIITNKIGLNKNAQTSGLIAQETLAKGRTFFYCKKYKNKTAISNLPGNNETIIFSEKISNSFGLNLLDNEEFYCIDKVFMTCQGTYLTLNPHDDDENTLTINDSKVNSPTINIEGSLKNVTVKENIGYGSTVTDLIGSYFSIYDIESPLEVDNGRIYINGLNHHLYDTISINFIKFNYDSTNLDENNYNKDFSQSIDLINKDFKRLHDRGYVEYASFNDNRKSYELSGANNAKQLLLTSSLDHNAIDIDSNIPDYEDFQSIFKKAKTPWVVSQAIGRWSTENDTRVDIDKKCKKLFRFHSCDDGEIGNRFRIRIKPKKLGKDAGIPDVFDLEKMKIVSRNIWSTFDISVKEYDYKRNTFTTLMEVSNVNLNPKSKNYICRLFGNTNTYYDIENKKIVDEGFYPKTNQYLYVEVHKDVEDKLILPTYMPSGFVSYPHINIDSIANIENNSITYDTNYKSNGLGGTSQIFQKPVAYVRNIKYETFAGNISNIPDDDYYWGVLFNSYQTARFNRNNEKTTVVNDNVDVTKDIPRLSFHYNNYKITSNEVEENLSPHYDYTKYFQDSRKDINVWKQEDNYLNSFFHLEKILYIEKGKELLHKYQFAFYKRDGISLSDIATNYSNLTENKKSILDLFKYVNINDLLRVEGDDVESDHSKYLQFDLFTYGGYDGLNCFDYDKKLMNNAAVTRELEDEAQLNVYSGPTYNTYSKALEITAQYENNDCDILCIPGIRHHSFLREVFDLTKDKNRFISIFDIPNMDSNSDFILEPFYEESYVDNENQLVDETAAVSDAGDLIERVFDTGNVDLLGDNIFTTKRQRYEEGSSTTLTSFNRFNFESRSIFAAYNDILCSIKDETVDDKYKNKFILPASALCVNVLSSTYQSPIINLNVTDDSLNTNDIYNFLDVANIDFISQTNEKDSLLRISEDFGINVIGKNESDGTFSIKFNSANSLVENRSSLFRLINNTRVLNKIKKNIMFRLYGAKGNGTILFENKSLGNSIDFTLNSMLSTELKSFVDQGLIKSYRVNVNPSTISNINKNSQTLKNTVSITFFGEAEAEIDLDQVLSNINLLIENFNENITIVRL